VDRKSFVPGVLELAGIPYVGSGAYPLTLTRHKHHAKLVAAAAGVRTAGSVLWTGPETDAGLAGLTYPVIVKPVAESSSIGIERGKSVVTSPDAAAKQARWVHATFEQPALVETFVRGIEVEVPLVGFPQLRPLGVVAITLGGEVVQGDRHLASDAVYDDSYGFQTKLPGIDARVVDAALTVANTLGVRDYGRVDFRVAEDGTPFFLEASTHPHIQTHSSFFVLAQERGLSYSQMLDEIVMTAARRAGLKP
jgi:D-alanine-D-alanine ligase